MDMQSPPSICAVAIVKGDERFIEEWIVYHRFIGVDRFMIYDNSPELPLRALLSPYRHFVTVIEWPGDPTATWPGRNLQTKTYTHALAAAMSQHDWVTFIDVDEFIVLRQHENLAAFLSTFEDFGSVRLNWHVFGHNGYYEDPDGLITSALTRRMAKPSPRTKAISRPESVFSIESAHFCRLKPGWRTADANARLYTDDLYPGKTDIAHINHYTCRSFLSWMGRVERGDVSFDRADVPAEHAWRLDPHLCLRQFVETVAKDKNELVDEYMLRFRRQILDRLSAAGNDRTPGLGSPRLELDDLHAAIDGPLAITLRPQPARGWVSRKISRMLSALRAHRLLLRLLRGRAGR
ncbi:MAG: hypothetical protein H6Q86_63 [candidate division NC10 bacterium]|nr:hypothetical protein [candidate division NC10 bacterium]